MTSRKLQKSAATLCARHCVAPQGPQQWCDTKDAACLRLLLTLSHGVSGPWFHVRSPAGLQAGLQNLQSNYSINRCSTDECNIIVITSFFNSQMQRKLLYLFQQPANAHVFIMCASSKSRTTTQITLGCCAADARLEAPQVGGVTVPAAWDIGATCNWMLLSSCALSLKLVLAQACFHLQEKTETC